MTKKEVNKLLEEQRQKYNNTLAKILNHSSEIDALVEDLLYMADDE